MVKGAVSAIGDPGAGFADRVDETELWRRLSGAMETEAFFGAWLTLQCARLPGAVSGLVLAVTEDDRTFATAATWPEQADPDPWLTRVAQAALEDREPIVMESDDGSGTALAYPLVIRETIPCIAVLRVGATADAEVAAAMRQLQWGVSWLESYTLRHVSASDESTIDRLVTALYLSATTTASGSFREAVTAFVTELATRLDCERVSCGFRRRRHVRVDSVSHTGQFGRQMNLVNAIGRAMDEAVEQGVSINYPLADGSGLVSMHHEALSRQQNGGAILTVPIPLRDEFVGAICIERSTGEPFDEETVELCESIASVLGPVLVDKRENDRWIGSKIASSLTTQLGRLLGPRYLGRKLALLILCGLAAFLYLGRGDFRVTADVVLEGAEQRAVVAPYDGYVATSLKRAGDRVEKGELIATLDDTDLRLDLVESTSARAQAQSQYDEALAGYDRAAAKVFSTKVDQADARIQLVQEQLRRTRLEAPLDGIIVSGDLSQSLGAAVDRGELLFEIAGLYAYRVSIQVDERDITHIRPGQSVGVVFSALPDTRFDVSVVSITPVTTAAEGRNFFRVEAELDDPSGQLRPGMEGVAKILVDERRYAWIWTRELVDWFRLWSWRWRR